MFLKAVLLVVGALNALQMKCSVSGIPEDQILPPSPVVTSASSQYFERIFNRLLVSPPVLEAPAFIPELQGTASPPTKQTETEQAPNFAFAVATAHAAAPVATILLPPFPFSQPQTIGFIPPVPPINVVDPQTSERDIEPTTESLKGNLELESETTSSFATATATAQGLPIDENVEFRKYLPPNPQGDLQKTSVEVVPAPLTYFTPPPPSKARQTTKHIYLPPKTKITIRPSPPALGLHVPLRIIIHKYPKKIKFLTKFLPNHLAKTFSLNNHFPGPSFGGYSYKKPS